jgi:hypothetical protein
MRQHVNFGAAEMMKTMVLLSTTVMVLDRQAGL